MNLMKKCAAVLSAVILLGVGTMASGTVAASTATTYAITDLAGQYKTQGRAAVENGAVMFDWSASGMEFTAECAGDVSITVCTNRLNTSANAGVYFTVVVDGVVQHADKRIPKNTDGAVWTSNSTNYPFHITRTGESTFTIATGLAAGTHTFAIYNQTEACHGTFGVKSVTLDGTITAAPAESDLYIEFVGDSITAGLGNISTGSSQQQKPLYQDATRGWAYMTAQALGADWSVIATSGICAGVGYGYSGAGSVSMQAVYPKLRYYSSGAAYDFARQPDVVVLGLGTNDIWCTSATNTEQGLRQMQTMVRQHNPNAKIVWIYGMMQSSTDTIIKNLVSSSGSAAAGYYALALPYDGAGGQGHPSLAAQTVYANKVTEYLAEILDLGADESPDGWVEEGGKWAYYVDGEKLTNTWKKNDTGWVYLGEDGYMLTNAWVEDSVGWCYVGANGYCVTNTWQKDSHGWRYLDASGRMATNQWIKDSVGWCYVGADGYRVTNCFLYIGGKTYAFDESGHMAQNSFVKDSDGWYYFNADGNRDGNAHETNAHAFDSSCAVKCTWCSYRRETITHQYDNACDAVCNSCGHTRTVGDHVYDNNDVDKDCNVCGYIRPTEFTGWYKEGDKWAYYQNGVKFTNIWKPDSFGWVYLDADGYMLTNAWVKDSVGWCYVGANGYCVTNTWQKDSHGWCYLDASGHMATNRWIKDSVGWCYVGADGYCVTNAWKKDSHGWCYLDGNGRMATNQWVKDSKGWCYVGADGYCVTNAWKKDSHGWCYLDANGRMVVSDWVKDGGNWYYLDASGYMVANKTLKIGGKTYRFNASGVWVA